jgi:hypothetical protein
MAYVHEPAVPRPEVAETLWKVIARFDTYMGTVNAKAALILTFDAFAVTALTLKWGDIVTSVGGAPAVGRWIAFLLAVATLAALGSIAAAFMAVAPYLGSRKAPGKYHSILFFEHVAEHAAGSDYLTAVRGHDTTSFEAELAEQAQSLATGLSSKFGKLRIAVLLVLYGILAPMAAAVLTRLGLALFLHL